LTSARAASAAQTATRPGKSKLRKNLLGTMRDSATQAAARVNGENEVMADAPGRNQRKSGIVEANVRRLRTKSESRNPNSEIEMSLLTSAATDS